jgi:hypothetical protein
MGVGVVVVGQVASRLVLFSLAEGIELNFSKSILSFLSVISQAAMRQDLFSSVHLSFFFKGFWWLCSSEWSISMHALLSLLC